MPRIKPNRLRDRLRRALRKNPNQIVGYTTLAWLLYPSRMTGDKPDDVFHLPLGSDGVPSDVLSLLSDTMRGLRKEHDGMTYHTVRDKGYMYMDYSTETE